MRLDQINWIVACGSAGLGVVIGILIASYWLDLRKTSLQALSSSVAIAVGGAVLGFFKLLSGPGGPTIELWAYGIGLFFGFCGTASIDWMMLGYRPKRADEPEKKPGGPERQAKVTDLNSRTAETPHSSGRQEPVSGSSE